MTIDASSITKLHNPHEVVQWYHDNIKRGFIYLASPFTDDDLTVQTRRFRQIKATTTKLLQLELPVFSPVAYGFQFFVTGDVGGDYDSWRKLDEAMARAASGMVIAGIPGWKKSTGVEREFGLFVKWHQLGRVALLER